MTTHHLILFVRLLLFLPVFLRCVFSKVTRLLAVEQRASAKPGAFDRPFHSVSASKNFHLNLTVKSKEKLLPNWSSFAKKKQPTA